MSDSNNVSQWIDLVKYGDPAAANRIWQDYFDRLMQSVRRRLRGQYLMKRTSFQVTSTVFMWRQRKDRFPTCRTWTISGDCCCECRQEKVIDKWRHDLRQRRGGDIEICSLDNGGEDENAIGDEPSSEMVLMMRESVEQFFSRSDAGHLPDLASARLEGYSNALLALHLQCSAWTRERRQSHQTDDDAPLDV